jgi:hypothetical protein
METRKNRKRISTAMRTAAPAVRDADAKVMSMMELFAISSSALAPLGEHTERIHVQPFGPNLAIPVHLYLLFTLFSSPSINFFFLRIVCFE